MDVGHLVRRARLGAGLSQRELAMRSGTSQPNLSAYETGRRTPSLDTLERLLAAAGWTLTVARPEPVERRKARALHEAVVGRIAAEPAVALAKARQNLARLRRADSEGHARDALDVWTTLLDGPVEDIVRVLLSSDAGDEHLASSSPFAGLLTPAERWDVLRRFRHRESQRAA